MTKRTLILAATCVLLGAGAAFAEDEAPALHPHDELNNWGKWGDDDERGAANYITPKRIVQAAKLIKSGKTFSLAIPLDSTGPVFPPRLPPHHTMTATGADYALHLRTKVHHRCRPETPIAGVPSS